jgi:poly(A) polymerase
MLQPRFERRSGNAVLTLLEQPRFRAGLDFLRLRGAVGEADPALAAWWEALYNAGAEERSRLLEGVRESRGPRRVKKASDAAPQRGPAGAAGEGEIAAAEVRAADDEAPAESTAPRKRRRRRRRPAEAGPVQ